MYKNNLNLYICCLLVSVLYFGRLNTVHAQCAGIDFSTTTTSGCLPKLVKFVATGTPAGSVNYWNFGQGETQGGDTILQEYTENGTYDVILRVVMPDGSNCSVPKYGYLKLTSVDKPAFGADKLILCSSPPTVLLTDSTPGVVKREWIIEGNKIETKADTLSYTFDFPGSKTITLRVTDANGCTGVTSKADYINVPKSYTVDFSSYLRENATRNQITASFRAVIDSQLTNITEYRWDFPGGSPSGYLGLNPPPVVYSNLTTPQDVTLTIKTDGDCEASFTKKGLIQKYYSTNKTIICVGERGVMTNLAKTNGRN
ncbi:MAG: hypothetical protein M3Q97_11940, partial [Bacteroidota bacterium]|nr:hypothetical protein [Bacteroidota bacterium]